MIRSMDMELRSGQVVQFLRVNGRMAICMAKEHTSGQAVTSTRVNGWVTRGMAAVHKNPMTGRYLKRETGRMTCFKLS